MDTNIPLTEFQEYAERVIADGKYPEHFCTKSDGCKICQEIYQEFAEWWFDKLARATHYN